MPTALRPEPWRRVHEARTERLPVSSLLLGTRAGEASGWLSYRSWLGGADRPEAALRRLPKRGRIKSDSIEYSPSSGFRGAIFHADAVGWASALFS